MISLPSLHLVLVPCELCRDFTAFIAVGLGTTASFAAISLPSLQLVLVPGELCRDFTAFIAVGLGTTASFAAISLPSLQLVLVPGELCRDFTAFIAVGLGTRRALPRFHCLHCSWSWNSASFAAVSLPSLHSVLVGGRGRNPP